MMVWKTFEKTVELFLCLWYIVVNLDELLWSFCGRVSRIHLAFFSQKSGKVREKCFFSQKFGDFRDYRGLFGKFCKFLENRLPATAREFESHTLRHFKPKIARFWAFFVLFMPILSWHSPLWLFLLAVLYYSVIPK